MYLTKHYKRIQYSLAPFYERALKVKHPADLEKRIFKYEKIIHREKVLEQKRKREECFADYPRPLYKAEKIKVGKLTAGMVNMLRQLVP